MRAIGIIAAGLAISVLASAAPQKGGSGKTPAHLNQRNPAKPAPTARTFNRNGRPSVAKSKLENKKPAKLSKSAKPVPKNQLPERPHEEAAMPVPENPKTPTAPTQKAPNPSPVPAPAAGASKAPAKPATPPKPAAETADASSTGTKPQSPNSKTEPGPKKPVEVSGERHIDDMIASPSEAQKVEPFNKKDHEKARRNFLTRQAAPKQTSTKSKASRIHHSAFAFALAVCLIVV